MNENQTLQSYHPKPFINVTQYVTVVWQYAIYICPASAERVSLTPGFSPACSFCCPLFPEFSSAVGQEYGPHADLLVLFCYFCAQEWWSPRPTLFHLRLLWFIFTSRKGASMKQINHNTQKWPRQRAKWAFAQDKTGFHAGSNFLSNISPLLWRNSSSGRMEEQDWKILSGGGWVCILPELPATMFIC